MPKMGDDKVEGSSTAARVIDGLQSAGSNEKLGQVVELLKKQLEHQTGGENHGDAARLQQAMRQPEVAMAAFGKFTQGMDFNNPDPAKQLQSLFFLLLMSYTTGTQQDKAINATIHKPDELPAADVGMSAVGSMQDQDQKPDQTGGPVVALRG